MTLHQLRIFDSVARHLNETKASGELHMSQPAVSLQLKLLEEEYRTKFHLSFSWGIKLTPQGQAFFHAIRPLLIQAEDIVKSFKANARTTRPLVVGGTRNISVTLLPRIIADFKQRHPAVRVVVETDVSHKIERRVLDSAIEIAIIANPSYSPDIVLEPFKKFEIVAFVASNSPLIGKRLTFKELAQIPLVVLRTSKTYMELVRQGYDPNVAVQCDEPDAVKAMVRKGVGIGVTYRDVIEQEVANGELQIIDVPDLNKIKIQSFIIYDNRNSLSAIAQEFLELLRAKGTSKSEATDSKIFGKPSRAATKPRKRSTEAHRQSLAASKKSGLKIA
jgi:LysR family transcriptional regulator, low CO2-responsive transcriptional regulator